MGVTADDVQERKFRKSSRGYAERDVRAFLTEIARTLREYEEALGDAGSLAHIREDDEHLVLFVKRLLEASPRLGKFSEELLTLLRAAQVHAELEERVAGEPTEVVSDEDVMSPDDLLIEARIAGEVHREILRERMLDASAVSRLLGSRSTNARQYANNLRRRGEIVGVPHRNQYLYPAFQFDSETRSIDPIVRRVNLLLGANQDPWGAASWWLSPNDRLSGTTPRDALDNTEAKARLSAIAEALTELLG